MIKRDPSGAARASYDLIIIGGGVYGTCLALEAARRGLHPILLERDDFGGATSWNTGRIIHGGIRYLQRLDVRTAREMARERAWFLRHFPDLVRPVPFVLPIYGRGLKRRSIMRAGLLLNDILSRGPNADLLPDRRLPGGKLISARKTLEMFPQVQREGLDGAGVWHDAMVSSPQRFVVEALRWACDLGATALNYVEAEELQVDAGQVVGLRARDSVTGATLTFSGSVVVNCAGPWVRSVAEKFDRDISSLFRPFLMTKALIDRSPPADAALAVEPNTPGSHVYFLCPCAGRVVVGGYHSSWQGRIQSPEPSEDILQGLIDDLNSALPHLKLQREEILRVWAGLLPAEDEGSPWLAPKETVHDHGSSGGPGGFISVTGVKYSRARLVGEKVLRLIYGDRWPELSYQAGSARHPRTLPIDLVDPEELLSADEPLLESALLQVFEEEAVVYDDDFLLRRTDWLTDRRREKEVLDKFQRVLGASALRKPRSSTQPSQVPTRHP